MKLELFKSKNPYVRAVWGAILSWTLVWVSLGVYVKSEGTLLQSWIFVVVEIFLLRLFVYNFYKMYKIIVDD